MSGQPDEPPAPAAATQALRSEDLLRGLREVVILHGDDAYRLRVTSNDRLILTK
jgi:hemin uptake protein HemP